jgi:hypothetical protein
VVFIFGDKIKEAASSVLFPGRMMIVNVDEENMFNFIKVTLNNRQYQDGADLCQEFLTKYPKSNFSGEVEYLRFYSLIQAEAGTGKYSQSYDYLLAFVKQKEKETTTMLSLVYTLPSGSETETKAREYSVDATRNLYNGLIAVNKQEDDKAMTELKKNSKYTQLHSQIYFNFPTFDLFTFSIKNKRHYPYIVNEIASFSNYAYTKLLSTKACKDLSTYVSSYMSFLEDSNTNMKYTTSGGLGGEFTQIIHPIKGSKQQLEYETLKSFCSDIKEKICEAYKARLESASTYINEQQKKEYIDRLTSHLDIFDSSLNKCSVTALSSSSSAPVPNPS